MPDERFLILQMHELLSYLSQLGVLTILILAQHGLVGPMDTPLDISYLADAVIMLRYFRVRWHASVARLSVVKKRSGNHEHTIREFKLSDHGIGVGPPLKGFSGIFSGTPTYTGDAEPLMAKMPMASAEASSGIVLVLAPVGRDAEASARLIEQLGLHRGNLSEL